MVRFSLFALPVSVEPWFWVMAFVLGRDLDIRDRESLISTVIFAALVFISILVHELGHALSGRWLAGERQSIRLWGFGGLRLQWNSCWWDYPLSQYHLRLRNRLCAVRSC